MYDVKRFMGAIRIGWYPEAVDRAGEAQGRFEPLGCTQVRLRPISEGRRGILTFSPALDSRSPMDSSRLTIPILTSVYRMAGRSDGGLLSVSPGQTQIIPVPTT